MPGPRTLLLIEGSFKELVEELADFLDNLKKAQPEPRATLRSETSPLLDKYAAAEAAASGKDADDDDEALDEARDEVLDVLVPAAAALNTSSDKEFIAAYNLLLHLVRQSDVVNKYLQSVCRSLSADLPAGQTKYGLALTVLTTIFNTTDSDDQIRYAIFSAILDVVARSAGFDILRPQLAHLEGWLAEWQAPPAKQRALYMRVAQIAREAGEAAASYEYLIRALRTFPAGESSSEAARSTSLEALKVSISSPTKFDFEDLTTLDAVQALRDTDPAASELLEIFVARTLEDYIKFKAEHGAWLEEQGYDDEALTRKMRLLTLATLASSSTASQTRTLPYADIAEGLQIEAADVEMWVIDVIRSGLVEGKLSQSSQTFLIHRSTYRVFTMTQWREVAGRLDMWKQNLTGVLEVIRQERKNLEAQKEQEAKAAENRSSGAMRSFARAAQREPIDLGAD